MNTQERINRAFSSIHASDNVLENVYDMAKHSKEKTKVIPIMLVGMVLLSTIVFAATHFHLSEKVLQIDEKELSPQMQESVTIIKKNNALSGRENQYVGGFLISYPFEENENAYTIKYCINSYFRLVPSSISAGSSALATSFNSSESISVLFKFA